MIIDFSNKTVISFQKNKMNILEEFIIFRFLALISKSFDLDNVLSDLSFMEEIKHIQLS